MSPSNSVGHGSVNDDNSLADHAIDDSCSNTLMTKSIMTPDGKCVNHPWVELRGKDMASGQVYQRDSCPDCNEQYEANKEALRQRRLELDRQLQALENENTDATSRSGGSLDRDGGSTSSFAGAERNINRLSTSSESHSTHPQPFRPPLPPPQSSGFPTPMPTTEEFVEHSYPQQHQPPRHQLAATGGGGNVYAQNSYQGPAGPSRIPSSASVGSVSTTSNHRPGMESFCNGTSVKTHGNASYPFPPHSNPYDPQFLAAAAAATAFHQQQLQQQQASIASEKSVATQQQVQKDSDEHNKNTSMLWKLLQDKEEELKEVRQTLQETQQKFQEQSLLATKLQTTLDQVLDAFEKERLLIKLQAEKEAQESLTSRQEEIFQKQLQWMENDIINKNNSPNRHQLSQQTGARIDGDQNFVANDATNIELLKANNKKVSQQIEDGAIKKAEVATANSTEKISENKYPWKTTTNVSPDKETVSRNELAKDGDDNEGNREPKIKGSDENKNILKIPSNFNNEIKLYPSIDETPNGSDNMKDNNATGKTLSHSVNQIQNVANVGRTLPNNTPHSSTSETPMANNTSNMKHSMNESMSSDRFNPVYVAQNADKDEDMAKEAAYFPNDDDKSLGQTVASSTYGDDRVKVANKKLLDPYGDKGTYTGVVLRNTGMPHGLGRMVYEEDRRIFEGDWRHGRWHGYGRASFSNGDSYEGEYKFDQRHGTGVYRWNDGRVYDGHFSEDKRHGKGIFTWPDGAVYDGDFVNGQRQGHGKYTFADGGQYEGSWKDGRYDGFGTCTWEDGRRYRGEWRNGMAHGRGTETYPNGNIRHEGEWVDDEPIR